MPYRPEHWEETADALKRYPEPKLDQPGGYAVIGLAGNKPVGVLVQQDQALAWYTRQGPDRGWAWGVARLVEETIQEALRDGLPASEAWARVLGKVPVSEVGYEAELGVVTTALREEWRTPDVSGE